MIPKNFSTKKLVYVHSSIKKFFHKSLLKGTYTVFTKEYNMGILQTVNSLFKELSLNSEWKFAWTMDRLLNANATTILHILNLEEKYATYRVNCIPFLLD